MCCVQLIGRQRPDACSLLTMTEITASRQTSQLPHPLAGFALGLTGVIIFSATLPFTHIALDGFSPLFITFARALVAAMIAGVALLVLRKRFPRKHLIPLAIAGLLLAYGFPLFSSIAMQTVPASHGGVVLGILPLMTAASAAIIGGERPGPAFWAWSSLGAFLVLSFSLSGADIEPAIGDLWLACAAISAACGYAISGKLSRTLPGWEVISWALIIIAPISLIGTLASWSSGVQSPDSAALAAFAYLALGSMFLGFVFWNKGLAIGGIARIGQVQLFQSFFTIALSAVLLGEQITWVPVAFASAVAFVVWCGRKTRIG